MIDYAKLKVEEIRNLIVEDSNGLITPEQVNAIKGKSSLIDLHRSLVDDDDSSEEVNSDTPEQSFSPPEFMSEGWSDYLVSLCTADELHEGNPNVNGLRRLANLVFEDILASGPKNVWTTLEDKPSKSTVLYEIEYVHRGVQKSASSVASSWVGNTNDEFATFSEAIAETRAEGRTLRKILGIKKLCAEELTDKNTKEITQNYVEQAQQASDSSITHVQKTVITKLCERLGIDLAKFINCGSKKYDNLDLIPYDTASRMIQRLNEYQTVGESSIDIPEEIKL